MVASEGRLMSFGSSEIVDPDGNVVRAGGHCRCSGVCRAVGATEQKDVSLMVVEDAPCPSRLSADRAFASNSGGPERTRISDLYRVKVAL